jgi:hypothetical protein
MRWLVFPCMATPVVRSCPDYDNDEPRARAQEHGYGNIARGRIDGSYGRK